ncbi:MAG: hypothetical protein KDC38_04475, partial [Planctomycetes bacterium]|nr:hypothetical protein [Planctomycetota bacterium]
NSELRIEYRPFDGDHPQFAIKSLIIKSIAQEQLLQDSMFDYLGAGAGIGDIQSATVLHDGLDRKTLRMVWTRWDAANQTADLDHTITRDISIFPNSRHIAIDYVDFRYAINIADLARPGGVSNGVFVAHGGGSAPRGYLTHDEPPGVFYSRYAADGVFDPTDGGPLNYNGHFITAVYNPANGVGFGRVMPVTHTHVIKLLIHPGLKRGLEFQNYPFLQPVPPFTGYLYVFTQGETEALQRGRDLVDDVPPQIQCGQDLELFARPYTNWGFTGFGGAITGLANPQPFTLATDSQVDASFVMAPGLVSDDFEGAPTDPVGWEDTGADNSLVVDDALFTVQSDAEGSYLATHSTATNLHSHRTGVSLGSGYTYTGRLRMTHASAGIGVTAFSQYPTSMSYYRLRRYFNSPFHLTANGTSFTSGTTETGVFPTPNTWYRFTLQVVDTGTQTEVRARVWEDGTPEPLDWQAEAIDAGPTRLTSGTVGVWTFTSGSKHFDELAVRSLTPTPEFSLDTSVVGQGTVARTPPRTDYAFGEAVTLEAIPDPHWRFVGWTGDITTDRHPLDLSIATDLSLTATFEEVTVHSVTTSSIGNGVVTVLPDGPDFESGTLVSLEAIPDIGWTFAGWTGTVSGDQNPLVFAIGDDVVATANFVQLAATYREDFESYSIGDDPLDWIDTDANNSLNPADHFEVVDIGGNRALATSSSLTNIHSHHSGLGIGGSGYQVTGRMQIGSSGAGIGVTCFSQFPDSVGYYRLRRYDSNAFHLAPVGTSLSGVTSTGVVPSPNVWYRFRMEVETMASETVVRARVWTEGTTEPGDWQAVGTDASPTRFTGGTIGVWSFRSGEKRWDDLEVLPLDVGPPPPPETTTLVLTTSGNGAVTADPVQPEYDAGTPVQITASPAPGWQFVGWEGALSGTTNPRTLILTADSTVTAVFQEIVQYAVEADTLGQGSVAIDPDQTTVDSGTVVTFTAAADVGWFFSGWQGDLSGATNPASLSIDSDTSVTATFAPITAHPVEVAIDGMGTVQRSPDQSVYDLGTDVTLVATPADGWSFVGWSGHVSTGVNPLSISIDGDVSLTASFVEVTGYLEDFEGYVTGADPAHWLDTDAFNALTENEALFAVATDGVDSFLETTSTATNIHSHLVDVPLPPGGYQYSGRLRLGASSSGIGVTFFSDFPNSATYYRMRRYFGSSFHITADGSAITGGVTDSGLVPVVNVWYRFRIEVEDTGSRTEIRGRVWPDGSPEPAGWPIDCFDDSATRFTSGTVGVWGFTSGSKSFDDLTVTPLAPPAPPASDLVLDVTATGSGTVAIDPDLPQYVEGDVVDLTAIPDPGWMFAGWSGDITGSENPLTVTMMADLSVTATFVNPGPAYLEDFESYGIGGDPIDWLDTGAGSSLDIGNDFFVQSIGGSLALHTTSTGTNLHSHYVGSLPATSAYEYSGRVRISHSQGGIGVTFFSDFPNSTRYYRLRRYFAGSFHITADGTTITGGDTDSSVVPAANTWVRLRIQVEDTGASTAIRARVWADGTDEPMDWSIDCFDDSPTRLTSGSIGVWSFYRGHKSWDDMRVVPLD